MSLPLSRPFFPMEAKSAVEIPSGPEWEYEPRVGESKALRPVPILFFIGCVASGRSGGLVA